MARHSAIEIATGAAILLVAGGFLVYAVANTGQHVGSGYTLHAQFDHADGLGSGAEVRIAGVKVGSVDGIRLNTKTYQADVAFTVQHDVALTTDGLLGGKYLALATGGDEATLKPGGTITITQGSVNLEALLGKYIFGSTKDTPAKPATGQGGSGLK